MDDLLGDFLAETAESLDLVDVQLVKFEREPNNAEILDNIFRLVHTIKGTCGFLGLPRLESVAHAAETLMGRFREGTQVTEEAVSLVLASLDRIKEIMADLEATQHEPAGSDADLIGDLIRLASNDGSAKAAVVTAPEPAVELPEPAKSDLHPGEQSLEDLAPFQRLSNITGELQEGVMKTRMQPIGNAWAKLPRVVRDLSPDLGKKIELVMIGEDTELDRQLLEHDQGSADAYGPEFGGPWTRGRPKTRAAGKPETGTISLSARHEGGLVIVEISDDGRGLPDRIRETAVRRGLVTRGGRETLSDSQIYRFIMEPGFSTADRGHEHLRARRRHGRGAHQHRAHRRIGRRHLGGGRRQQVHHPDPAHPGDRAGPDHRRRRPAEHAIETVNDSPILRLRGRLLPLVRLSSFFRHAKPAQPTTEDEAKRAGADNEFVVVLRIGGFDFGIVAEAVFDTEEIVVKPLTGLLKNVKAFSGNTILGDGSVVMIIDPSGVAEAAGMRAATRSLNAAHVDEVDGLDGGDEAVSLLVFRAGSKDPRALPLALINRLEEIDLATVERSAGHDVIQYRGVLMPLIRLDDGAHEGMKPVIVIESNGYYTGLVVDEIVDVVEERLTIEADTSGSGALGSAVIAGKVTEIVDLAHYMPQTLHAGTGTRRHEHSLRILLVDDSAFFRNMLKPFLAAHGFHVAAVSSAAEALEVGKRGRHFDVIVSDIEMPDMNGYEFIGAAREASLWQTSRFIALSGHAGGDVIDKAHDAGYAEHVAKFDRTRLLDILKSNGQDMGVAA
jgi:two-component system, chemotaxis family, sensor kinase CheA